MNLIRWIASTVLSALLLPQILGVGSDASGATLPPEIEQQLAELAAQAEARGGEMDGQLSSFFIVGTDDVLALLEDGWNGLQPVVEVVNQVKSATSAAAGPAVLPPGVRLAKVTLDFALPISAERDTED